jgi:Do/DeqQ family serine protease
MQNLSQKKSVNYLKFSVLCMLLVLSFQGVQAADPIAPPVAAVTVIPTGPISYADAVALAAPAVVSIKTTKEIPVEQNPLLNDPVLRQLLGLDPYNQSPEPQPETPQHSGLGSGVIVSDKGYILTNHHVIKNTDKIIVTLADGRTANAKIIGVDPETDLAVLQIQIDNLPVIPMGVSKTLRVGDIVLAIGNPFGFDKTVTHGIVSAMERTGSEIGILENLIQTDAAINPGNSGGALIDAHGRLIGINTAIYSRSGGNQGIGFAIPIDQAMNVMNQLITGGHIVRGYLGVNLQGLSKEIRDSIEYKGSNGAYVRAVVQGSPAQKAGILPGDVITKIENTAIKDEKMALQQVANLVPGKNYTVEIFRHGEYLSFSVSLGERKQTKPTVTKQEPQKPK